MEENGILIEDNHIEKFKEEKETELELDNSLRIFKIIDLEDLKFELELFNFHFEKDNGIDLLNTPSSKNFWDLNKIINENSSTTIRKNKIHIIHTFIITILTIFMFNY